MPDTIASIIRSTLLPGKELTEEQSVAVFSSLFADGEDAPTDSQIGALLFAYGARLPSAAELTGAARALRAQMTRLPQQSNTKTLVDTCGTGGSGLDTFNTSTVAAFVAAGAGQPVAKHGNRRATSRCGSADLLEALGVKVDCTPQVAARCLERTNFCFMFAPHYHAATRRVQGIRRELGFRTIFNFLGPLSNPCGAQRQVLGVSEPRIQAPLADALLRLGCEHALVVHGEDGLDEITTTNRTKILEIVGGTIRCWSLEPEAVGLPRALPDQITGYPPTESAAAARAILQGDKGPRTDLVLLNAGASIYIGGIADTIEAGVTLARESIHSGCALRTLEQVIIETQTP